MAKKSTKKAARKAEGTKEYKFRGPVLNLLGKGNVGSTLPTLGKLWHAESPTELSFPPLPKGKLVNVAALYHTLAVVDCYLTFVSGLGKHPRLLANAEDMGPFEVIFRGDVGRKHTLSAYSLRYDSRPQLPLGFQPSIFYADDANVAAIRLFVKLLEEGKKVRAVYRLTNGACGARYWEPRTAFMMFSPEILQGLKPLAKE